MPEQLAVVTGANGFVGRRLVQDVLDHGWAVRSIVRSDRRAREMRPLSPVVVAGDPGLAPEWADALAGASCVIHLAARVHIMNDAARDPLAEFRRVNVDGTRRLLDRASEAGVRRFVFLSSVKAVGEGGLEPYTEDSPCAPSDPYGISKLEAENVVRKLGKELGIETVIIRPPVVYGPHVKANLLRLMQVVSKRVPLPLGSVRNARSLVYVGNLVAGIRRAMEHPKAAGETFFVSDGEDISTPELVRRLAHHLGSPVRLVPVPVGLMRAGAAVLGRHDLVERLAGSLTVDGSRIRTALQWQPPFTLNAGLADMTAWYRSEVAGL